MENSKPHTQIIHFVGGIKRTIHRVISVWENECIHIMTADKTEYVINKSNVLFMERSWAFLATEDKERGDL